MVIGEGVEEARDRGERVAVEEVRVIWAWWWW
jgi:hypothetical protein